MDASKFTDRKTGEVIHISIPESDFAFIPDPLPPKWDLSGELWPLLCQAKEELGRLDGMARGLPNPQLLLSPLRREESLTSSRLEGTFATAEELMLFELSPREPQNASDPANAWKEVSNYNRALALGFTLLEELPFCCRLVRQLHDTLLGGVRGGNKNPGEFRKHQVHIGSNKRYIPPSPDRLDACLNSFELYINDPKDDIDPLVRCFLTHYQLEAIHPFSDGNGRIGRVLLSLMIYKWCNLKMPWLYMSPFFDRYKDEYIDNLFRISTEGAWSEWIEFCLRGVIHQSKAAVSKCERLQAVREQMRSNVMGGRSRAYAIIEMLFESPMIRITDVAHQHTIAHGTATKDIEYLVEKKILRLLPRESRPKTYYAPDIIAIANESDH